MKRALDETQESGSSAVESLYVGSRARHEARGLRPLGKPNGTIRLARLLDLLRACYLRRLLLWF